MAEPAKALWDKNLSVLEISRNLKCSAPTAERAVTFAYESRGLRAPNVKSRRGEIITWVKQLFDQDWWLKNIAAEVGYSTTTVRAMLKEWHAENGQAMPDLRSRRHRIQNSN